MEAISSSDVFVALLRQKLAERARAKGSERKREAETRKVDDDAAHPIAAATAQAGADDRHLRRTIVGQLLAERWGTQLVNEPRFQQIVEQVTELMAEDAELGTMLVEVMSTIRK